MPCRGMKDFPTIEERRTIRPATEITVFVFVLLIVGANCVRRRHGFIHFSATAFVDCSVTTWPLKCGECFGGDAVLAVITASWTTKTNTTKLTIDHWWT